MNKLMVIWKASNLQLRVYIYAILVFFAADVITQIILALSLDDNTDISIGNLLLATLVFVGSVLPAALFKRIVHLGATRKEYYTGLIVIYAVWAAGFSILNLLWYAFEQRILIDYQINFNLLEIFHWDQFNVIGTFLYQFCVYMLLLSLLSLLFSGLRHYAGWALWVILIAAIPIGTSLPNLRPRVADGFRFLLFNDSLLKGAGTSIVLSAVFLAAGWWFTNRRTLS